MVQEGIELKVSSNGKDVDVFEIRKDSTKTKIFEFKTNLILKSKNKTVFVK
jgi:hypothetical protein